MLVGWCARMAVQSGAYLEASDYLWDEYGTDDVDSLSNYAITNCLDLLLNNEKNFDRDHPDEFVHTIRQTKAHFSDERRYARLLARKGLIQAQESRVYREAQRMIESVRDLESRSLLNNHILYRAYPPMERLVYLHDELHLADSLGLFDPGYSIWLPPSQSLLVVNPMQQLVIEASKHPDLIRSLTPREFEKFIGEIFAAFEFDVQVTRSSADGNVDIICTQHRAGIPVVIAVETKRYSAENKIGVELVRQFVGANRTLRANKLVYATTSSYTKGAIDFARENFDLLELKAFDDIQEWCKQVASRHATNRI